MPFFNTQPSNEMLKPFDEMGFGLNLKSKTSKRQSKTKTSKESSDLEKLKSKSNGVGQQCSDTRHKAKHDAAIKVHHRESGKGSSTQPDELVKYMSNVPAFLKRSGSGESIQGKALNVGVLDWSQLEKWKNKQTHFTSFNGNEEASSSSPAFGHNKKIDGRKDSTSSRIKAPHKEVLPKSFRLSSQKTKLQFSETKVKTLGEELRMTPWDLETFGKTESDTSLQRVKRNEFGESSSMVGNFASKSRHHGVSLVPNESSSCRDIEEKRKMEGLQPHSLKDKERNTKSSSDKGIPPSESINKAVSYDSKKKMNFGTREVKKKTDHWNELHFDTVHKLNHRKPSDIVLLRPRKFLQPSSEDYFQHSQSRTSSDEEFSESSQSSSSYISLPEEVCTEDVVYPEVPHSSVLPSQLVSSQTMQDRINADLDVDHSSVALKKPACSNEMSSLQSEDTFILNDVLDIKLRDLCAFSNMNESQDHEIAEPTSQNPASHRWLSLSFSRIGRSLSFKEGSTLRKQSGPESESSSACLDNLNKEKVNGHKRTRSSPFVRLLDPLLKYKGSNTHHSDEHSVTSKGSMNSFSLMTDTASLLDEIRKESPVQALLQVTMKNGLPLFKFVINSERKVLAATMKSLAPTDKDDADCYYTFYLVNEIKKKNGKWMSHWSKEKNCRYVYNIVGQMKVSSSKSTEPSNRISKRECVVKEYVLMGVEIDQQDQEPPQFIKSKELAAVVIEIPSENFTLEGLHSHILAKKGCLKCFADERCFCSSQVSIKVILPGGVHSSPITGEPSPLIHRWKLGGICDCGGWDVGCKLLVLSNQDLASNTPRSSKPYLERFELFVQEGAEQSTPLFTLVPLNDGLYSVEFSSTINHLQAFFISVVVLSSKKLPSSLEMNHMQEEINKEFSSKNNKKHQGNAPINYNPIPPVSPVDRV